MTEFQIGAFYYIADRAIIYLLLKNILEYVQNSKIGQWLLQIRAVSYIIDRTIIQKCNSKCKSKVGHWPSLKIQLNDNHFL